MLRRTLLTIPALALAGGLLPGAARVRAASDDWQGFHAALAGKPWLLAFRSVSEDSYSSRVSWSGRLPAGLRGTLYRNGPAGSEVGGFRAGHWFDGDGMVQAFRIDADALAHQARMIRTHKRQAEADAGRALYAGFGTRPPAARPPASPDTINPGNISVLHHGGRLLALWEAGSPWDIDPDSLATRGLHSFSPATRGAPFSAHPRLEADGQLWNFGYASGAGLLVLWHLGPDGAVRRTGVVPCEPMGMPHDFLMTARHLVLLIPPFHYQPDATADTFMAAHRWQPDQPTRVLVVDKSDFSSYRWLELPAQWVFHFGNAWEDEAGVIRFDGARSPDPRDMVEGFAAVMRGEHYEPGASRHHRYELDTRAGTIREAPMFDADLATEFPVIDPRVSGARNHRLVMLARSRAQPPGHPLYDSVVVYDERGEQLSRFRYAAGMVPEEHLFVPAPGSAPDGAGWVLGPVINTLTQCTELNVFDVSALEAGPVASASLPYALPLGLHGRFVAA